MDFLLFVANRWHFLFPPLSGATGRVGERDDPSSGAAAWLNGCRRAGMLSRGADGCKKRTRTH